MVTLDGARAVPSIAIVITIHTVGRKASLEAPARSSNMTETTARVGYIIMLLQKRRAKHTVQS